MMCHGVCLQDTHVTSFMTGLEVHVRWKEFRRWKLMNVNTIVTHVIR